MPYKCNGLVNGQLTKEDSVKNDRNGAKNRIRMNDWKGKRKTKTKIYPIYDIKFWLDVN